VPFYGFAVMCVDHPEVHALVGRVEDREVVTYGENPQADVQLCGFRHEGGGARFDIVLRDRRSGDTRRIEGLGLPMPGKHNVLNAVSAITVADRLGITPEAIRAGLAGFEGVKRRFTLAGTWNGVSIYDDYGHHPVEIAAVLEAARGAAEGRVIAVVQPHRYTRLKSLFDEFCACFDDADTVVVADVYPAGETPIDGADRDGLVAGIRRHGHRDVRGLERPQALAGQIAGMAGPGDIVVCLGAGSISQWANALPGELEELDGGGARR
jgi:UDP-N-acetylmuramate--alanine ligase